MLRALAKLPGGLGRFIPGRIGANHGRLRHVGWEKCCHGLTCRPLESSGEGFLSDFLSLLGYPAGSGRALLDGTLKLKCHNIPFARKKPTWRLPGNGQVPLVIAEFEKVLFLWRILVLVVLGVGIFFLDVSKGSDLPRKPKNIWYEGIFLLGMGGWCMGIPVLGADWIGKELAEQRLLG